MKKDKCTNIFTVVGTNSNGIVSKLDSLTQLIDKFQPAVWFLQETKVSRKGQVKVPGYDIFEVVRKNSNGGSILTAVHSNLQPVYISGGEDDMEILVIQAKIGNYNCRFINAYGPQEYAKLEDKIAFYARLDQEVKNAKFYNCMVCLEMDANAKVGLEVIKNDPNQMSSNGEYLVDFTERNNLIICNATDMCYHSLVKGSPLMDLKEVF